MSLTPSDKLPLLLAITGASGSVYGLRLLQYLIEAGQPVELMVSCAAEQVFAEELDLSLGNNPKSSLLNYLNLPLSSPLVWHNINNFGASVASGSYRTRGMAVVPCSLGSLAALSHGLSENLIHRAAAVCLKERRPLFVLVREMPFDLIQLRNMVSLTEAGAIVAAASPGFYHRPQSVADQIDFVVGRSLDQLGFDHHLFMRWKEESQPLPTTRTQAL